MIRFNLPRRLFLLPLNPLYRMALSVRELWLQIGLEPVRSLRWPVVSIGNLSTGGSGKTPMTIALARAFTMRGVHVDVLSRGYGRQSDLPARVKPDGTAEEFGDEPLLIAHETGVPIYVAASRYEAGLLAEKDAETAQVAAKAAAPQATEPTPTNQPNPAESAAAQAAQSSTAEKSPNESAPSASQKEKPPSRSSVPGVHLLDDGFQHRQLTRDVDILLIDREDWRDWLLPAGNLREPLLAAHRASVIAIPAEQRDLEIALRRWGWQGPIWRLRRKMDTGSYGGPVAAFCGIGRPEQFFQGLEAAGVKLAARLSYPDHFVYTAEILKQMIAEAHESGAVAMVTTGKDLARMGKLASIFTKSMPLVAARLYVDIENKDAVLDWLEDQLGKRSARASVPNAARLPQSSNRAQ